MQKILWALTLGAVLSLAWPVAAGAQTADPIVGTWELNLAKSKFAPGEAPKSQTRTYVVSGSDIKATSKGIGSDGKLTAAQWTINDDGKDRPETGNPDADSVSFKRIDPYTVEFTERKAGKVATAGTRAVSRDGKVLTITSKGTGSKGQPVSSVMVFDKR